MAMINFRRLAGGIIRWVTGSSKVFDVTGDGIELAASKKIVFGDATEISSMSGAGLGDVSSPGAAVADGAVVAWDGTGGANVKAADVSSIGALTDNAARNLTVQASGSSAANVPRYYLKMASVAHGLTDLVDTNTFGIIGEYNYDEGGMALMGISDAATRAGLALYGIIGSETPSSTLGALTLVASCKDGTNVKAIPSDTFAIVFRNYTTEMAFFSGDGKLNTTYGHVQRTVTDAGPMTATPGTAGEIAFNTSDTKFYGCTVTHAVAATWVALH